MKLKETFGGSLWCLDYVSFSYTLFWLFFSFQVIIHVHTWCCIYNFYYFPYRSPPVYTSLRTHKVWIYCDLRGSTDSHPRGRTRTPVPPALPWVNPCMPHQHALWLSQLSSHIPHSGPSRPAATGTLQGEWAPRAPTLLHTPVFSFLTGLSDLTPSLLLLSLIKTRESGIQGPCGSNFTLHWKQGFLFFFLFLKTGF